MHETEWWKVVPWIDVWEKEKIAGKKCHKCLAADGPDDIINKEDEEKIMVWIQMSCEDEAECYVEFLQPETEWDKTVIIYNAC